MQEPDLHEVDEYGIQRALVLVKEEHIRERHIRFDWVGPARGRVGRGRGRGGPDPRQLPAPY